MGLDMYLHRRHYVQRWNHITNDQQFTVTVMRGGEPYRAIDPERVAYVIEQVAYWRKANQIHRWFVDNVQNGKDDCREYPVSRNQLRKLLDLVNHVMRGTLLPQDALPTQKGFFFGSATYSRDYHYDLEETKRQLEPLLAEENKGNPEYYYRSSW